MTALVVGGVVALGLGQWIRQRPQRAVLLLAALLPYDGLLLLVPHPGIVEGWKEGLVLLAVGAAVIAPSVHRRDAPSARPPWAVPLVGLFGLALVSLLLTNQRVALIGLKVMLFYAVLPFAMWRCPLTRRDRDRIVTLFMVNAFVTAAFGIVQQILGGDRLNQLGFDWNTALRTAGGRLRSISTFNQPFPFAFYVTLALLIGLSVALADPRRLRNKLFLVASPMIAFGMLTAIVRGAILALGVGLVYLAISRFRPLVHAGVAAIVALLLFVPGGAFKVFTSSTSLGQRQSGWSSTAAYIVERPLGYGLGAVGAAGEKAWPLPDDTTPRFGLPIYMVPYQPDNQYITIGLQLGVLGLWSFLLVVFGGYAHARRIARTAGGDDASLAHGIAASILGAAVAGLVATYWEIFPLDLYFWMTLGVLLSISNPSSTTPSPSAPGAVASRPTSGTSLAPSHA